MLNELNQIQVEDYSTPLENVAAFTFDNKSSEEKEKKFDEVADKKKNEMSLDERFKKAVKSVEVFDTVEDFEKYLNGEKRKAFKSRMIYKKPESEDSDLEYGNDPLCLACFQSWTQTWTKKNKRGRRIGKNGETEYHVPKPGISEGQTLPKSATPTQQDWLHGLSAARRAFGETSVQRGMALREMSQTTLPPLLPWR